MQVKPGPTGPGRTLDPLTFSGEVIGVLLNEVLSQGPVALVGPSYNVYYYTDQIYKIVHFKRPRLLVDSCKSVDRSRKGGDRKLAPAISRAKKVVLELALCNKWEWFGTFTLDKTKYDRYNLDKWYKDFTQWIRDQRKKHSVSIRYVLVPELHQDGAWHMHGLLSDLPPCTPFTELRKSGWRLPNKLVDGGYWCWCSYHEKFGYNSLGPVRSAVGSAFYMADYVGEDFSGTSIPVGRHLYYACRGLNRSTLHGSVYGDCDELDRFLVNKYEWVETGFTKVGDNLDWTFALEFVDALRLPGIEPTDYGQEPEYQVCSEWYEMQEAVQQAIDGFS